MACRGVGVEVSVQLVSVSGGECEGGSVQLGSEGELSVQLVSVRVEVNVRVELSVIVEVRWRWVCS